MSNSFYRSEVSPTVAMSVDEGLFRSIVGHYQANMPELFNKDESGQLFGTVAMRCDTGFWTNARAKHDLVMAVHVPHVDHNKRVVYSVGSEAALNAPLMDTIFKTMPDVQIIVHSHAQADGLPTVPFAPSGSGPDSRRLLHVNTSFNIAEHGCVLLFDKAGKLLG
jgi:hypothetical protein